MKKILILASIMLLSSVVQAATLDFSKYGNEKSNKILKEFIKNEINDEKSDVISYFYDINNDNVYEILGIVKSQFFYSLKGYKLFVLKKDKESWEIFKSDIIFDPSKDFNIENNKITYRGTVFYKNKKYTAIIKENEIKTSRNICDLFSEKKAHDIEEITKFTTNQPKNEIDLTDFGSSHQRSVNINYTNLNERTKHYLDLK